MKVEKLTCIKRMLLFSYFSTLNSEVQFFYLTILFIWPLFIYLLCILFLVSVISTFSKIFMETKIYWCHSRYCQWLFSVHSSFFSFSLATDLKWDFLPNWKIHFSTFFATMKGHITWLCSAQWMKHMGLVKECGLI